MLLDACEQRPRQMGERGCTRILMHASGSAARPHLLPAVLLRHGCWHAGGSFLG
jgi:hypothetical protein